MTRSVTGMMAFAILACVILSVGCIKEEVPGTVDLADATTVGGHAYRDGQPVAGARVEAVSVDGSQRIANVTNDSGAYVLGLQPRVWYKITASSGSLKHTVSPVYVPEEGNRTCIYDINLTGTSTLEGGPMAGSQWKGTGIYIAAAPANGDEPITTVTGEDGNYTLTVKPGVYYTVTATSYDPGGSPFGAAMYYRNSVPGTKVKPGTDETILLDYLAQIPYPAAPSLIVNGTVGVLGTKVGPPARAPTSPVPAGGRVYLDNKTIKGARVEAVSIDGTEHVSAMTNDTGTYVLMLEPGVMYRATATYNGLKHSIWPLIPTQNAADGRNDIHLTSSSRSTIAIFYSANEAFYSNPIRIEAIPTDGGGPVIAMANGSGWCYLDVMPGVKYNFGGRYYDSFGQRGDINIDYARDGPDNGIIVGRDETIIADMRVMVFHPPKSLFMWRDPVTGSLDLFKPPVTVPVTGRVYIDGRPARGANVTAKMSGTSEDPASTITDESGTYVLNLSSRRQYEITATWQGLEHTVRPILVQDYSTGIYDIQLTQRPGSIVSGRLDLDQEWPVLQGNVITAAQVGGSTPVMAITGTDSSYSLEVKPYTYYDISGKSQGPAGESHSLRFYYRTGISCEGFMLRPNETVLIDYRVV